jgi:hypothetical protein
MNELILALAVMTTIGVVQISSALAQLPAGCTKNPHDSDSGPTGNPHDPGDTGNPHDVTGFHHESSGDTCPGAK